MSGAFLYAVAIGVCAGTALALLFGNAAMLAGACVLGAIALLSAGKRLPIFGFVAAAAFAAAALGLVRADFFLQHEAARNLAERGGHATLVEGRIVNDPERRETTLHAHIEVERVGGEPAQGKALAFLPRDEAVRYGDRVVVRGTLEAPEAFEAEGGRLFDYPSYLRARGVSAVMYFAQVREHGPGGRTLIGALYDLKHAFTRSLNRVFAEPQGSLLAGLLLGERRGLPEYLTDAFIVSGLIHVVVLSGYNISIVADAILRSLRFLPRSLGFALGGTSMILFVLMIGGGATAVRALIMGLIAVVARYFGRTALALRALALAAVAMVLWNPLSLLYDPSFILSVIATFGLVTLSPAVEARLPTFLSNVPQLQSIAASTIAVQFFVLPALLYMTGVFSLVALPANMLALPAVPFAMGFGFFTGLLGFISPVLALPLAAPTDFLLRFIMFVAETANALPHASTIIAAFPLWLALAAYTPLTAFAIFLYTKQNGYTKATPQGHA